MRPKHNQSGLLTLGFFALTVAIIISYNNPAESYELSIYRGTPLFTWLGVTLALTIGLLLSFQGTTLSVRFQALFLSGLTIFLVVSLPLIRGYYLVGEGDTMSHVGRARDLLAGTTGFADAGYPAVHTISIYSKQIIGITIPQSFHYIAYIFVLLFLVFIPLVVRSIEDQQLSIQLSAFVAFLLLPINQIGVHMLVHPTTQAILFVSVLLYIFTKYLDYNDDRYSVLFIMSSLVLLLLHPQQALNFFLLIGMAAITQFVSHRTISDFIEDRPIYVMTIAFGITFYAWFQGSRFENAINVVLFRLLVRDTSAAAEVGQRGLSLSQLGTGPVELFLKLFAVSSAFCLLAGGLMILILFRYIMRRNHRQDSVLLYLTIGFVPIMGMFFFYIVADITTQYFRHFGFMMVLVTIFGAIALNRFIRRLINEEKAKTVLVGVFLVLIVLSLLITYPSPYIFKDTDHVPKSQVDGYETAFNHQKTGTKFLFVRSVPYRYEDFHYGASAPITPYSRPPDHFANQSLSTHYNESRYLAITGADRQRDPILYKGFRYSHADFRYLETEPNISHVQAGGEFDLYLVKPEAEKST